MDMLNPEVILKSVLDQQIQHQKKGEYTQAEQCRLKYLKQKDELHKKSLADMHSRHKQEQKDLKNTWNEELTAFNQLWDSKMSDFQKQSETLQKQLQNKHTSNYETTRQNLDRTLPIKLKQSSQLLNLRKMEEHLAKQKNYVEAKKVQSKIASMNSQEKQVWDNQRKLKMDTALNTLKHTQNVEMENLKQRIKNSRAERNKERKRQEDRINLKYENFMNDMKKLQQKQVLAFKGDFKSLGGTSGAISSPQKSRSSMFTNSQ